jgi:hypothetical protein
MREKVSVNGIEVVRNEIGVLIIQKHKVIMPCHLSQVQLGL